MHTVKQILVPIKRVIDTESHIKIREDGKGVCSSGVSWIVNPFDEIALEEALRIKEKVSNIQVVVVSVEDAELNNERCAYEQIRSCLALGADRAIVVECDKVAASDERFVDSSTLAYIDSHCVARVISELVMRKDVLKNVWLILMGKQSIDSDSHQTGGLIAGFLNWPQATCISKIVIDENNNCAVVHRELDSGVEVLEFDLPAVVTVDLRLNEPRYPTLVGIVNANRKGIERLRLSDFSSNCCSLTRISHMSKVCSDRKRVGLDSIERLSEVLSECLSSDVVG